MNNINSIEWWDVDQIFIDGEPVEVNKELDPVQVIRLKKNLYLAKGCILSTKDFVEINIGYCYLFRLGRDYICKVTKILSECIEEDDEEYNNNVLHLTKLFDVETNDVEITQVDKELYLLEVNNDQC